MDRRSFFRRIAQLAWLGTPVPPAVAAAPRVVELQRSPLAGFQYHAGEAVWPWLAVGAALDLAREADNPYDSRAVRIDWQGRKLGYVPRIDNAAAAHLIDNGHALRAAIVGLRESRNPWDRVEVALYLAA